ncbi:MAG: YggS family pyridoxal phosphate-dependent enzyme [Xanthomonadales bacterium]|jgi:pyridoxal phosphate enzyme (YggS family)|nr:YggS family pyridoxal phosphate-dependent enzyme [Xanthomonadales bacterium]
MNNLKENLNNIRSRVDFACRTAARPPSEVVVLAVSKRHSVEKIAELHALGQTCFGENYVQEALDKMQRLSSLDIEWHFIGPLQSNKTREVAQHFHWVQSVDREKILRRLSSQRTETMQALNVCIQVNIDREPQKAGVLPEAAESLARLCTELPGLRLRGLMSIPHIASDDHDPADSYRRMKELYDELLEKGLALDTLSMGMSADLEAAVRHGSTMVRIGTDLFGQRPPAGN